MKTFIKNSKNLFLRAILNFHHRCYDNFIFIHINKTGGSSIEKALHLPFEHLTALEKIKNIGQKEWKKKFTFTIIRNPWDKVVSHYHYRVQTNQTNLMTDTIDFKKWVNFTYGKQDSRYYDNPKMFMPQINWIADLEGNILIDFICRFEKLNDDFNYVCKKIGKTARLPHTKASNRWEYSKYYDDATREIVAHWFRKDIEMFGYYF